MTEPALIPMRREIPPCHGVFAWFGIPLPLQERLRLIREAGFQATSIWWESRDPVRNRLKHYAPEIVREAGLYLDNIHVPYRGVNALWQADQALRDAALKQHTDWLEDCARHEIPVMVMHAIQGNGPDARNTKRLPELPTPVCREIGLESFGNLVMHAERLGVRIAVENIRHPAYLDTLFEAIASPSLGFCYDVSHDWLHSPEPFTLLQRWGHRLLTTHMNDTDGRRDRHWLPGLGNIPFEKVQDTPLTQFSGTRLLEVTPKDRHTDAADFLKAAWERRNYALC